MLKFLNRAQTAIPRDAQHKRTLIQEERDAASALSRAVADEFNAAQSDLREIEREKARLTNPHHRGVHVDVTEQVNLANAGIVAARERIDRIIARRDDIKERAKALGQLCRNLDAWLASVPVADVLIWKGPEPKLGRNETPADALERCRRRIRQLDADRHTVNSAPIPSDEAKAIAKGYVAHLAEIGAPDVYQLVEAGERIEWPERQRQYIPDSSVADINSGSAFTRPTVPHHVATLAWMQPDAFLAALNREIDQSSDDEAALTAPERKRRLAEIASDKLAIEREEESWVERVAASGTQVVRRADADPRAVLGLADHLPPPTAA